MDYKKMKKIVIADADKISTLSTTEIFKELYPGIKISIVQTFKDILDIAAKKQGFDAFIIDFSLPDLNATNIALKLRQISKIPFFITGFENQDLFDATTKNKIKYEDIYSVFLKKPLQSDLVRAICTQKFNPNAHLKTINTNFLVFIQKIQNFIPMMVQECGLNGLKVKKISINEFPDFQKSAFLPKNSKITLRCPALNILEFSEESNANQMLKISKDNITKNYSLILKGKFIEIDENEDSLWFECEDKILMKKVFEAVLHQKMREQMKHQMTLLL